MRLGGLATVMETTKVDPHIAEASQLWSKKEYGACKGVLEGLATARPHDAKVKANLVAAAALACEGRAGKHDITRLKEEANSAVQGLPDSVLLLLNTAAVLFHAKQYAAAAKLLDPVCQAVRKAPEPRIQEDALLGSCLLLINIYFAMNMASKAAGVVSWLEQRYELMDDEKEDSNGKGGPLEPGHQREDSMHSGDFSQLSPSSLGSMEQASKIVSGYNLSQLVLGYKSRLRMLAGDLKGAKHDIRNLLALDPRHNQGLSLKAELEARRGNLRRAGKLVTTRPAEDAAAGSAAERVQVLCNMGYVQHREGKHHTAALCFSKALQTAAASRAPLLPADAEPVQLGPEHVPDADVALLYNSGLQALLLKQYDTALHCFQGCAGNVFAHPVLWLRMAECCVEASLAGVPLPHASDEEIAAGQEATHAAGEEQPRFLALRRTLQHGKECAANAVYLFNTEERAGLGAGPSDEADRSEDASGVHSPLQQALAAQESALRRHGRLVALSNLAYLCLQLGQPASALKHARTILKDAEASSPEWQLGQNFLSEALCQLGKAPEAAEHLQAALAELINHPVSTQEHLANGSAMNEAGDGEHDASSSTAEADSHAARGLLLVNLASTYFSSDDFTQAQEFAKAGAEDANSRDALLMHVYLELCRGETGAAVAQLKSYQLGTGLC